MNHLPPINTHEDHWQKLALAKRLAMLLDTAFTIPGTRQKLGLDALLGVFPVAGDVICFLISFYIIVLAKQVGVPSGRLALMTMNLVLDTVTGSVPVLGDALDVLWKANVYNVGVIERHLMERSGQIKPKKRPWHFMKRKPLPPPPGETIIDIVPVRPQRDTF